MENHPLTPMRDADIRRWLAPQTRYSVGHVAVSEVMAGPDRIATALASQQAAGHRHIVVDAISDADLFAIGAAARGLPLITGGSGVAMGLPANFGCVPAPVPWQGQPGRAVVLSGSCSTATRAQVAHHAARHPAREVDAAAVIEGQLTPAQIAEWLLAQDGLPLAYSSADPARVAQVQERFGRDRSAAALEAFFAEVARLAVAGGARRIITAGGETSGAVVNALGVQALRIGRQIDPGVPWTSAVGGPALSLALKSGNFGGEDFFAKALATAP